MSDGEIIQAPHGLSKAKIGFGPAKLDPKAIERAEQAVKNMEGDYAVWAQDDLATMEATLARLRARPAAQHAADMAVLFRVALDMKGQGSSFGYRLITRIADLLAGFVQDRASLDPFGCDAVAAHLAAMRAIFAQEVRDDGGETGRALVDGLEKLIQKAAAQDVGG
jgi:chemotaxis protein histidine kinase CheA